MFPQLLAPGISRNSGSAWSAFELRSPNAGEQQGAASIVLVWPLAEAVELTAAMEASPPCSFPIMEGGAFLVTRFPEALLFLETHPGI